MKALRKAQLAALRQIKDANKKRLLMPADVVRAARRPTHPLHKKFTWDDTKAAQEYRLWQAREIIAEFRIIEPVSEKPIHVWISLKSDRKAKGGYRESEDILKNPKKRAEWLAMALDDLQEWERTYGALTELAPIFKALARVRQSYIKAVA